MSASYVVGTVEYVKCPVTSDVTLSTQPVEIMINGAWLSAAWTGSAGLTRTAQVLVDFTAIPVGNHVVYVRITDTPEVPVLNAGFINVSGGAA